MAAARRSAVLDVVRDYQAQIAKARIPTIEPARWKTVAETAGFRIIRVELDVTSLTTAPVIDVTGYSVTVVKGGSDRLAFAMDLREAGVYGPMYPGVTVRAKQKFSRIALRPWVSVARPLAGAFTAVGSFTLGRFVTLAIGKTPDAEYVDPSTDSAGFIFYRTTSQTYNQTNNIPTSLNDGIDIRGVSAVKVCVRQLTNIIGGTVVWWYHDGSTDAGQWGETDLQQPLVTGRTTVYTSEVETPFESGRLFPELRSVTLAGGSGALQGILYGYGEGGDLCAGDVVP